MRGAAVRSVEKEAEATILNFSHSCRGAAALAL